MSSSPTAPHLDVNGRIAIDEIIAAHQGRPGGLLGILEAVQDSHPAKYLPTDTLEYIAAKARIPLAQIFSVVTFYALFNLEPQGKNTICICRGTACHTRGSRNLLERLKLELGIHHEAEEGQGSQMNFTTADQKFSLRTVACFGQCALAPVVEVNHSIFGHVNEQALHRELQGLQQEARK